MGWYAQISGGVDYKYGDAVALADACRLGELRVTPRIAAMDEGGDHVEHEDLEFMGPLQARIKTLGLPWSPEIEFSGMGNESTPVPLGADVRAVLTRFRDQVRDNADSILKAVAKTVDNAPEIVEIDVSIEFDWTLPAADQQKLVDWLNAELDDDVEKISLEGLRRGTRDEDSWYQPPDELEETFEQIADDDSRRLAAHALAQALLGESDEVFVGSPDDNYHVTAWRRDGEPDDVDEDQDDDSD